MATDIKLDQGDGNVLMLEGRVVKIEGSDLILDALDRRHGGGVFRRALVHDGNDGLTINYNGDYPGGVTITHLKEIVPQPGHPGNTLAIRGGISYEYKTVDMITGHSITNTVNLDEELNRLQSL